MKLRVLGCCGGSAQGRHPTSFLIDDRIAVDGGAVTANLTPTEQEQIDHVVLSHAHLDHVANLPFLLDNRFARQTRPIHIHGPRETLDALKNDLFNNRMWPDFTALRNKKSVSLELHPQPIETPFEVGHLRFIAHPMPHPVPCFGYLIRDDHAAIYIAGDTGSAQVVKEAVVGAKNLKAIVIEISWPDRMLDLARLTGHLVPSLLREAWPLHESAKILITHIKPFFHAEVVAELKALGLPQLEILEDGMQFAF